MNWFKKIIAQIKEAQAVLEKSQDRATRMAEQLSSKNGGKTDKSFGGKTSISM